MESKSLQDMVRSAAADLKRKLMEAEVPPIPPSPAVPEVLESLIQQEIAKPVEAAKPSAPPEVAAPPSAPPAPPSIPDDLESLIQSEFTKPVETQPQKKAASPAPPPPARPASFSPPPAAPASAVPVAIQEPPTKAGLLAARGLGFCWTGLIGVLSMTDRAVPAPLKARKTLLGRIGIAATLAAMLGLVGWFFLGRK